MTRHIVRTLLKSLRDGAEYTCARALERGSVTHTIKGVLKLTRTLRQLHIELQPDAAFRDTFVTCLKHAQMSAEVQIHRSGSDKIYINGLFDISALREQLMIVPSHSMIDAQKTGATTWSA